MDEKRKALIDGLNEDLANEYAAIIMYNHYAANVQGLAGQVLKPFFQGEVTDEIGHAQFLAEKIVYLGGTPTVEPKPVKHTTDVKQMLENTLQAEIDTIKRYTQRVEQAEAAGEIGLKIELEDLIADETRHKMEIERLLRDPLLK
ncbi:Ferritin Dps family protein [Caldalkalibacillus thermarum TA2.A1]|uniref:Ferritin Dps family protein n=1 Tax=Caldalkalibacillus thermarum (strain TA2.A1) TaxID=986075 RepID=F5L3V3_CALTT|nr:ferritin-like domain-containing protein [Caldalkalibacillus thermarum]EGL83979.1 Ferritin Dps family protein [Caldalkalibacillus thermarum TA2.A1]QZT34645.1 ferritin-like domain-containing protein [Caldalkalibacillus thermarum TA2.A1]